MIKVVTKIDRMKEDVLKKMRIFLVRRSIDNNFGKSNFLQERKEKEKYWKIVEAERSSMNKKKILGVRRLVKKQNLGRTNIKGFYKKLLVSHIIIR